MAGTFAGPVAAQKFENLERDQTREMLRTIAEDIHKHYYDPKLHGFDFDGRVREADEKIRQATSLSQAFSVIGWALDGLNDSHTYFIPPGRTFRTDYGWRMQMVGGRCYVIRVRPKSDAEAKGLKPGDEILSLNAFTPTRDNFPTLEYVFNLLAPRRELRLQVRGADGRQRQLDVLSKIRQLPKIANLTPESFHDFEREIENADRMSRTRCNEMGEELAICKIPEFNLEEEQINNLIRLARKHKGLILDLRDNPGGS